MSELILKLSEAAKSLDVNLYLSIKGEAKFATYIEIKLLKDGKWSERLIYEEELDYSDESYLENIIKEMMEELKKGE